jgi:hypothetical protein
MGRRQCEIEIEFTVIVFFFASPVMVTTSTDFLPVARTSSTAFAFPAESNVKVDPSCCTRAKDLVFTLGAQYRSSEF